ncbi:unnamed protein product [Meloidogyne enterolobii]|uniref:Uncharacterized protein n=1 Tax=Meloidogyne enterolobii TaxID=390850 RepID=A0ACB0ZAN1_MELEN
MLRVIWLVGLNFKEDSCSSNPNYINEFISTLNFHMGKISNKNGFTNQLLYGIYSNHFELENMYVNQI